MAFNVGDNVVCQKTGGHTGKAVSPAFPGTVSEVLGGGKYRVRMKSAGHVHIAGVHFKGGIVDEAFMTAA